MHNIFIYIIYNEIWCIAICKINQDTQKNVKVRTHAKVSCNLESKLVFEKDFMVVSCSAKSLGRGTYPRKYIGSIYVALPHTK